MPIAEKYTTAQNVGTMNHRTLNKTVPYYVFYTSGKVIYKMSEIEINLYTKNDVLLFVIPTGTRETILNSKKV